MENESRSASPASIGRSSPGSPVPSPASSCENDPHHPHHHHLPRHHHHSTTNTTHTSSDSSKLSFGISRILSEPSSKTSSKHNSSSHNNSNSTPSENGHLQCHGALAGQRYGLLGQGMPAGFSPPPAHMGLSSGVPGHGPHGPHGPHMVPGLGCLEPGTQHGVIKVPAHRPIPLGSLSFSPLMFPWMQDRKERLTGTLFISCTTASSTYKMLK